MIPASQIAAAKAVPMPALVGAEIPLKRAGSVYMARCLWHPDKTPSLAIYKDHAYCHGCGVYLDPIEWVRRRRGVDFAAAVAELCGQRQETRVRIPPFATSRLGQIGAQSPCRTDPRILALWHAATSPGLAQHYLRSRNLASEPRPEALRGHPTVWCGETRQKRPAMLCALRETRTGELAAVQRIWIDRVYGPNDKGARAADLSAPKKVWGHMGSAAVQLAPAGRVLGLAEGVETGLAVSMLYRLPCWATCGQNRLDKIALPDGVQTVIIFGDRGGEKAAAAAESAYRRRGYSAQCEFPESCFGDFAEAVL